MNKIEKLIKEMCPNGVEYKKLDEIANILKGQQLNKEKFISNGEFPVYNGGKTYSGFYNKYNQEENSIILNQGGSAGLVSFIKRKFWASAHCFIIKPINQNSINNKFLFYLLKSNYDEISKLIRGTTIPGISIEDLKNFKIDIPSIEIQTKIVNILDKLQDYSKDIKTGLPLEIEQRQKQYEYYRNLLLDFKANAQGGALANNYIELLNSTEQKLLYSLEYKKLWELVNFDKKFNNVAKYKQEEILYFVHISAKKLKEYKLNSNGDVKILSTGNYEGFTNYIQNDSNINYGEIISIPSGGSPILKYYKGYFIDSLNILFSSKNTSKINLKFIYYFLINNIFLIEENFRGSSIKHPNMLTIIEINIPLPSIEVQNKIVNILDRLQDYSKDIKTGLPLEIEQRQKQYEYYRNLFLNLKKQYL